MPSLLKPLRLFRTTRPLSGRYFSISHRLHADSVRLVEVGPRDGLQNEKMSIPVDTKTDLVRRLATTGLRTIEAGSFVSPKWIPQVQPNCPITQILPLPR